MKFNLVTENEATFTFTTDEVYTARYVKEFDYWTVAQNGKWLGFFPSLPSIAEQLTSR